MLLSCFVFGSPRFDMGGLRRPKAGVLDGKIRRRPLMTRPEIHCPAGGCQSSTLLPSGSMTQPNFPYSESSTFSSTLHPSSRSA